jgi:two-component system, OmpR family, phosphate regulon sensor histidine kinase PhoR
MKTIYIKLIIIVMAVSLLGLLGVQFYWLGAVKSVAKEQFKQEVFAVLSRVNLHLERQEAIALSQDLKNADAYLPFIQGNQNVVPDSTKFLLSVELLYENGDFQIYPKSLTPTVSILSGEEANNPALMQFKQYQRKLECVATILKRINESEKPIQNRLNYNLLDSAIRQEMAAKGLKMKYEFAVFDTQKETVYYASSTSPDLNWFQTDWRVRLFPNDIRLNHNYLGLVFADEDQYWSKYLSGVLLIALIFVVLIVTCFGMVIWTVFRQKRTSEVTRDFINNMTHELKTPITNISLVVQMLQDVSFKPESQTPKRYIKVIQEENERLRQQVEKVLQIARLERKDFRLNKEPVDAHAVIELAVENMRLQIEERKGTITAHLNAQQPIIEADELHFTNIIINLIDNANKYSPDAPQITILTQNIHEGIEIRIQDQGKGIPKKMLGRVFEKFYRVPTGNVHDVKGFGLGLSYVKTIVEAHKGNIHAESELGKGSTFVIFIPFRLEND